jgi:hypothetical protein
MAVVADRAFISRNTLARVEKGDPAVSFGIYASVMQALGLVKPLADVVAEDEVGTDMEDENLPQRVRVKKTLRTHARDAEPADDSYDATPPGRRP